MTKGRRLTTTEGMFLLLKSLFRRGSVPAKEFDETDVTPEAQPIQELPPTKKGK